jgi:hypothetical protein
VKLTALFSDWLGRAAPAQRQRDARGGRVEPALQDNARFNAQSLEDMSERVEPNCGALPVRGASLIERVQWRLGTRA